MVVFKDYGEAYAKLPVAADEYVFSRITERGDVQDFVLCDVFLDAVLDAAEPDPDGWHGILLEYHCNVHWLDEPWTVPDISSVISTIRSVPADVLSRKTFGRDAARILPELVEFLEEAAAAGHRVILSER